GAALSVPHMPPQGWPTSRELRQTSQQTTAEAAEGPEQRNAAVAGDHPRRRDLHRGPRTSRPQAVSPQPPQQIRRKDLRARPRPRLRRRALTSVAATFGATAFLAAPVNVPSPPAEVSPVIVPAERTALEAFRGAADRLELESAGATSAILDRPTARVRAVAVQASRAAERSELADDSASANGMAAALVPARQRVIMPLAEGSYRI